MLSAQDMCIRPLWLNCVVSFQCLFFRFFFIVYLFILFVEIFLDFQWLVWQNKMHLRTELLVVVLPFAQSKDSSSEINFRFCFFIPLSAAWQCPKTLNVFCEWNGHVYEEYLENMTWTIRSICSNVLRKKGLLTEKSLFNIIVTMEMWVLRRWELWHFY